MNDTEALRCLANLSIQCMQANLLLIRRMMSDSQNQLVSTRALCTPVRAMEEILDELHKHTGALA